MAQKIRNIAPRNIENRPLVDVCGHGKCESEVVPGIDVQLCQRHLAKAWAAFQLITGSPEPERQPDPTIDYHSDETPGAVYFIRVGEHLKIGWTTDIARRFRQLNADAVLHVEAGTRADERSYHQRFNKHLAHGREWFACNEETMSAVNTIRTAPSKAA